MPTDGPSCSSPGLDALRFALGVRWTIAGLALDLTGKLHAAGPGKKPATSRARQPELRTPAPGGAQRYADATNLDPSSRAG